MKLKVHVKIGHRQGVLGWNGEQLTVGVDAPPVKNAANERLIETISEWLVIKKNQVKIVSGHTSRHKFLDIKAPPVRFNRLLKDVPKLPTQGQLL